MGSHLEEIMPHYHFRERHGRLIAAPPQVVYEALHAVTLGEMPLVGRPLLSLRSLPSLLAGKEGLAGKKEEPLLKHMLAGRFILLADEPGREIVVGIVGQMWKPSGGLVRLRDAAQFLSFDRPGYVKVAMNQRLEQRPGGIWLSTETRILATDDAGRRRFRLYWLIIRSGSGAIRWSWLRAIARRAEGEVSAQSRP